ncbi:hypothetical protein [Blautia wexlerae]|uniref:hypothetical protein n=1 Tax=Blautia wexlerae TaxID=418240 RepID=UPI0018A8E899|nr:hypothetical protein [Blautia wexlerae]MDB2178121.1 hypothetical protein [Blautia wexlerae]MDB6441470.1 hypothetical protein [Blautia wexlerae]
MNLTWMKNGFICKDLYAPFVLEKDSDYLDDLKKKYKIVLKWSIGVRYTKVEIKVL